MPEKKTLARARRARRQGKAPTTQAGEFVREEMEHARRGKHPVRSRKQAIAIGLSKARRAGVKVTAKKRTGALKTGARKVSRAAAARKAVARTRKAVARTRKTAIRKAVARKTARRRSG